MTLTGRATAARFRPNRVIKTDYQPDKPRSVRSGKGLGDALYLQSIVRYLILEKKVPYPIEVCTSWPDVFRPLREKVKIERFRRDRIDASFHYIGRKRVKGTDQFIDCCIAAGLSEQEARLIDLRLDWAPRNSGLIERVKKSGKPVVLVQLPREPMGRADGYGHDLLPDCRTIQRVIDRLGSRIFTVQVGAGRPLYRDGDNLVPRKFSGISLDLSNRTSVSDLLDVASVADGALGYCSFIAPLAESFRKPTLLVWSRRGLNSLNPFVQVITPDKIIHRPETTRFLMDDCSDTELAEAVDALCQQIGSRAAV